MNARRSSDGRARVRGGRGRGLRVALAALVVCLLPRLVSAGVWTPVSIPVSNLTAIARTDTSVLFADRDSSQAWEYDGLRLTKLSARYAPPPAFGNNIRALAAAPNGDVWVGTDIGAFRLSASGFTHYTKEDGIGSRLDDRITDLLVAPDGTVWAGTNGGGLSRFDGMTWSTLRNPEDGLPSNTVTGLALASDGTLWVAMHNLSGPALASYQNGAFTPSATSPTDLTKLIVASDGRVWAVSANAGAYVFDAAGNLITHVQAPTISNDLTSITEGPHGDIWIGSFSTGVYRFNGGGWENYNGTAGLTNPTARGVTTDGGGALWVATGGGLFRFEGSQWLGFNPTYFPAMNGAQVKSISRGPASDFTRNPAYGVTRGPTYAGLLSVPPPMPGGIVRIEGLDVEAVLDSAGQPLTGPYFVSALPGGAWGTRSAVLYRIGGAQVTRTYPTPDGLDLYSILGLADGTAWAGTDQNLLRFDGAAWSVVPLASFVPARLDFLAADSTGAIWLGSKTKGAARYDPASGSVVAVAGLPSNAVQALHVAANGEVWIGTAAGSARYHGGAVDKVVTVADGLPSNVVTALGTDQTGRLWVGTSNGVAFLEPGAAAVYNTGDGLPTATVLAMLADTSEALLGCSLNGLALFHRDGLAPRVAFTEVPPAVSASRTARVDFAGGDLSSDNAQVDFSWSLDGQTRTPFSSDKTARLSGLTDDRHDLRVWARDRALNVTPAPATITFDIDATAPQPRLVSPSFGDVVRGTAPIVTLIDESKFASWTIDERPAGQDDPVLNPWTVLATSTTPPAREDTLYDWDTKPYLDGVFELRLSVTDNLGLTGYAIVNVTIDNLSPGNAVTSPARVDNTSGGRVFTLNAEVEIYFPPHALDEDRIITIDTLAASPATLPPGASALLAAWHVTPAGFDTKKPVTLTFQRSALAGGGAGTDLGVFALAPDGSYSFLGGSTDEKSGTLVTRASRLSDFVVARGLFSGLAGSGRSLDVQPRAFSPLGTTFDDRAAISFNLGSAQGTRVLVYDKSGRLVRRVFDGELGSGLNVVYWDGKDGNGDTVASGLYLVAVEAGGKTDVRSVAVVNR